MQQRLVDFSGPRAGAAQPGPYRDALRSQADAELRDVFIAMRDRGCPVRRPVRCDPDTLQTESRVRAYLDSRGSRSSRVIRLGRRRLHVDHPVLGGPAKGRRADDRCSGETTRRRPSVQRRTRVPRSEAEAIGPGQSTAGRGEWRSLARSARPRIFAARGAKWSRLSCSRRPIAPALDALPLPPDAKALISVALQKHNELVLVPPATPPLLVGGRRRSPVRDEPGRRARRLAVLPSGQSSALVEYKAAQFAAEQETKVAAFGLGVIAGIQVIPSRRWRSSSSRAFANQVLPAG